MILCPILIGSKSSQRNYMISHIWNLFEELTFSAYLFSYLVSAYYFSYRQSDLFISMYLIGEVSISTFFISYLCALPFYLLVERPFKNFLTLVLFPPTRIFQKIKDLDDESEDESNEIDKKEDQLNGPCKDNDRISQYIASKKTLTSPKIDL